MLPNGVQSISCDSRTFASIVRRIERRHPEWPKLDPFATYIGVGASELRNTCAELELETHPDDAGKFQFANTVDDNAAFFVLYNNN